MSAQDPKVDQMSRHVDFAQNERSPPSENTLPTNQQWFAANRRDQTNLGEVEVESRAFRHAHLLKRPRAWQYKSIDQVGSRENSIEKAVPYFQPPARGYNDGEERSTDNLAKQLSRLGLFIDLIWVGIVANLSLTFSNQAFKESGVSARESILEFILLFIPVWRIWDHLRSFCINHFNDDLLQRNFVVWILVLAVVYGINAPFAFVPDGGNSLKLLIAVYLISQASFLAAYAIQAISIPFLRRRVVFNFCALLISSGLWIATIYVPYPGKIGLIFSAIFTEYPVDIALRSPAVERYLTPGWKRVTDIDNYVERHEGFFIIILGEGVFRLIEGSPSGLGINRGTATIITTLLLYYALHWLYFNGDSSKSFVHALRRTWWKPILWQL
jgi:low temperature requirement protein LtrA